MMDYEALSHAVEAILFASGEPVKLSRLAGLLAALVAKSRDQN